MVESALLIISWRSWKSCTVGSLYENTGRLVLVRRRKQYSSSSVPNREILSEPYYPCEKFTVSKSTTTHTHTRIWLFRTWSMVLYIRLPARNPHFHKNTDVPCHHHCEDPPIESFIILPSPRTISRAYPRSLNDVTTRRSMVIIHERQRSIIPVALSSLALRSDMDGHYILALRLKSCVLQLETTRRQDRRRIVTSNNTNV